MLRGLERAFGEYLIRVLVTGDPSLADHPYELGKRFAMHGTAIQRYLNSVRKRPS